MAIKIQYTGNVGEDGCKLCIYGKAGIGKTKILGTARKNIVLSCESGLKSLKKENLPYIEIHTVEDLYEAYNYIVGSKGKRWKTVSLDSISEIAEVVLSDYKKKNKDPRHAYGEMAEEMNELIRKFRDIKGKNVVFTAKRKRINDDGVQKSIPSMPGQQLKDELPYFFDELLFMTLDDEGDRVLLTSPDYNYEAKDRSGVLKLQEQPNLDRIFRKIRRG